MSIRSVVYFLYLSLFAIEPHLLISYLFPEGGRFVNPLTLYRAMPDKSGINLCYLFFFSQLSVRLLLFYS